MKACQLQSAGEWGMRGVLIVLICGLMASLAPAATFTWAGASGAGWVAGSWTPAGFPGNAASSSPNTILQFISTSAGFTSTENITGTYNLNELDFEGAATGTTAVTISNTGSALDFQLSGSSVNPSIVQNSAGAVIVQGNGGIVLGSSLTLTGTGGGLASIVSIISGGGGIVVNGGATYALTAANAYSGGTTVNSGVLRVGSTAATSTAGSVGTGTLTLNGGTLSSTSSGAAGAKILVNAVSIGSGALVTLGNATNNGALTLSGSTMIGANATVTTASNVTFSGNIALGNSVTFATAAGATLALSSLDVSNGVTLNLALGGTPLAITGALTDTSALLDFNLTGGTQGQIYTLATFGSTTLTYAELNLLSSNYALDTAFGTNGWNITGNSLQVQLVPEPPMGKMILLGLAAFGFIAWIRRVAAPGVSIRSGVR